jgi:V/A-type H+/Na+-transporting ATPase subunit C
MTGMGEFPLTSSPYIYVCTRLRVRRAGLLPREVYLRMLGMNIPQITRFIWEHGYGAEVHDVTHRYHGIDLIEVALTRNLASSFQEVIRITPGHLKILTAWYLHRWDIANVMSILRALHKGLPRPWISSVIVPAGELDRDRLARVIAGTTVEEAIGELAGWKLHKTLSGEYAREPAKGRFARTENALYRQYYADLLSDLETGLRGSAILKDYIRLELDITNFRNLLRLRTVGAGCDCSTRMIPGGTIPVAGFQELEGITDREAFVHWFRNTRILPLLTQALRTLKESPAPGEAEALDFIWERWSRRRRPVHEVEMAVAHLRLSRMDRVATAEPFSVLAILAFLEHKKYEVFNIRAIARGISSGIPPGEIRHYLVI